MNQPDPAQLLDALLGRLDRDQHSPFTLGVDEHRVAATSMVDRDWLDEQLRLRGLRWGTDDARVLVTLWWYSASSWVVGPTLISLALGDTVLSADLEDLTLHWLPDSRITGAASSRVMPAGRAPIDTAAETLRGLFERVVPVLARSAEVGPRPLWAIAADSIANRLLGIGRGVGEVERVTALLHPLSRAIGPSMPKPAYTGAGPTTETRRVSCCLLYLAPGQTKCGFCPKLRRHVAGTGDSVPLEQDD